VPWGVLYSLLEILAAFGSDEPYCAIYSCHSAGTTSTAIFLRREGTNSIAIGMCVVLLVLCAVPRTSTFKFIVLAPDTSTIVPRYNKQVKTSTGSKCLCINIRIF
jgi:hypothetical protein